MKINNTILKLLIFPLRILTVLLFVITVSLSEENDAYKCSTLYKITTTQINVRDKPSISGKIVEKLNRYDNVCVTAFSGKWAQIDNGWISRKYITTVAKGETAQNKIFISNVDKNDNTIVNTDTINNSMETDSPENISDKKNTKTSSILSNILGILVIVVIAFMGFFMYNFFIHSLIALKLAEPDGRKKMGIRSTLLGRFVQGLLVFLLFVVFMMFGLASK